MILKEAEKEIWSEVSGEINNYDFVFFLPPEFTPQEDGVRLYVNDVGEISDRIHNFLDSNNIKYYQLSGPIEARAAEASKIILS